MVLKNRKFVYLSDLNFDGTVFCTQVIDWLELYQKNGVLFDLYKIFYIKEMRNLRFILNQIRSIKNSTSLYKGYLIFFPSKGFFVFLNVVVLFLHFVKFSIKNNELLIFARGLLGKEINLLKRIFPSRIIFVFDARGAAAEENRYIAKKENNFSFSKFKTVAHVYYTEYRTVLAADKIFSVSNALKEYFINSYNVSSEKFIIYPCLSDSDKFYYSPDLRMEVRNNLHISYDTKVFIYSGGIGLWHMSERLFTFFVQLLKYDSNSIILFLTKSKSEIEKTISEFPEMKDKHLVFSVSNIEVNKYLNAADYGILFRENTLLNNVASPTKFAEYMLCGLPVIISEGVGDYSDYIIKHNLGIVVKENELREPEKLDFGSFFEKRFDRTFIANSGEKNFSKNSIINLIIAELVS